MADNFFPKFAEVLSRVASTELEHCAKLLEVCSLKSCFSQRNILLNKKCLLLYLITFISKIQLRKQRLTLQREWAYICWVRRQELNWSQQLNKRNCIFETVLTINTNIEHVLFIYLFTFQFTGQNLFPRLKKLSPPRPSLATTPAKKCEYVKSCEGM